MTEEECWRSATHNATREHFPIGVSSGVLCRLTCRRTVRIVIIYTIHHILFAKCYILRSLKMPVANSDEFGKAVF